MMFNKIKTHWLAVLLSVVCVGVLTAATAQYVTNLGILQLDQNEIRDSSGTSRIFLISSRLINNGPFAHGDSSTTSSITLPTTTTGASFSHQVPVYNPTASTLPQGTALISSNTGAGYVNITGTTIDLTGVIGVAAADIAATSKGWMIPVGGGYAIVLTTGTVAVGDVLVTSGTVAGRLGTDNTPTTGAEVAVAMTAGVAAGSSILAIMK